MLSLAFITSLLIGIVYCSSVGLRLLLLLLGMLFSLVLGKRMGEGRECGLTWALILGEMPPILNGLLKAANDRVALIGD